MTQAVLYGRTALVRACQTEAWPALEQLLLERYVQVDDNGCWNWLGRTNKGGYIQVQVRINGKRVGFYLHRMVAMAYREGLGDEQIHHACANTRCLNPEHLLPVTANENMAEMKARQHYIRRIKELEAQLANCSCNSHMSDTIVL